MKFAHISDAQLGYVQYGLTQRADDFDLAFRNAVDLAVSNKVDAVVFGGDMFELARPAGKHVKLMQQCVERLRKQSRIAVLGIEGNHDIANGKWLDVCGIHDLERDGPWKSPDGVVIGGLGYRREHRVLADLEVYLAEHAHSKNHTGIDVLALHQAVAEHVPFTTLKAANIVQIAKRHGLRHLAMGHIHAMYSSTIDGVSIVCPGSLEMTDIDEPREKYIAITEIGATRHFPAKTDLVRIPGKPILYYVIESEEMLKQACDELPGSRAAVVVAKISSDIVDGMARLATAADNAKVPHRLVGMTPEKTVQAPTVDRTRAVLDLTMYVERSFPDENSPERSLVTSMIATPDNCTEIATDYINSKLKELGYGGS